jgi:Cu(I)/Ag(I) efflux system membrane fusion protein
MKEQVMKTPISKSFLLIGVALFVLGTATGGFLVLRYRANERPANTRGNAPAPPGQPGSIATPANAAKADMAGMSESKNAAKQDQTRTSNQNMPPGTVNLNPDRQQMIGVRYTEVRRADMKRTLRTVGLVQMDEEKIARVHVKVPGWIETMYLDYVGKLIKKGQPLFTLYSPDLVSTEQEYLIALKGQAYLSKVT